MVVFQLKGTWEQDPHCRFHPTGESTYHERDQSTDQQVSPFSSHSKGIHRKVATIVLWHGAEEREIYKKAGGWEVYNILKYFFSHSTSHSLSCEAFSDIVALNHVTGTLLSEKGSNYTVKVAGSILEKQTPQELLVQRN